MARPSKSKIEEMATIKIENAYWHLLEKERFSDITIRRITQEAGVNRNSFYYHYIDMEDLAEKAFKNKVNDDIAKELVSAFLPHSNVKDDGTTKNDPQRLANMKHIIVYAGSESIYLQGMVKELIRETWFQFLSIKDKEFSFEEKMQIEFIFAGLLSVLGSEEIKDNPLKMNELSQTELGKSIVLSLKKIALGYTNIEK